MVKKSKLNTLDIKAYAKINLGLDICGRRRDGYHNIDSIACMIDLHNIVKVSISGASFSTCEFDYRDKAFGASYTNPPQCRAALLIAQSICTRYNLPAVDITIEGNIPLGGGVGGSSADAGGVAYLMGKLFDIEIEEDILFSAGADVPLFYNFYTLGGTKRVGQIGSVVGSLPYRQLHIALVYTACSADTRGVFAEYDKEQIAQSTDIQSVEDYFLGKISFAEMALYNGLEQSALRLSPNIEYAKRCLIDAGFSKVVLTGSGSSYIGVEENEQLFNANYAKLNSLVQKKELLIGAYKTINTITKEGDNGKTSK